MLKSIINDAIATTKAYTEDFIAKKCENDTLKHALNQNDKEPMRLTNYSGKKFSILGDSISTMIGIVPDKYKTFYNSINCAKTNVHSIDDTWWGKVIKNFDGVLLANSSYAGSSVTSTQGLFPCINSNERIEALSKDGIEPDVVILYAGFNDWVKGKPLKAVDDGRPLTEFFDFSYTNIIVKITKRYPNAEIWCCTLCKTKMSLKPDFVFPSQRYGVQINEYNEVIREMANRNNCCVLDLYSYETAVDTVDSSHPNSIGMNTISSLVCQEVENLIKTITEDDEIDRMNINSEAGNVQGDNFEPLIELSKEIEKEESEVNNDEFHCPKCNKIVKKNEKFCMFCGNKLVDDSKINEIEPIEIIDNRYELIRKVGKGASSSVYLARDTKLDRVCAVKIVNKNTYADMMAAQESLDEANKLKQLAHVSIPQLYDIYNDESRLCIVMEFIDGKNLREILNESTQLINEKTIINWAEQLCRVFYYLHTLTPARIYRDLKPANIILQSNGIIKLIDFGTMKNYDDSVSEDTVNLGTKGYAAPEQFGGRGSTDARTDIYNLGMTLFHLITGISPANVPCDIQPIRTYRKDVSEQLEKIIQKCIAIEREERYQSAMDILFDLEKIK